VTNHQDALPGDAQLRMQLRSLAKEREMERDLWPGIQARLQDISQAQTSKKRGPFAGFALAASVVLVALIAWSSFSLDAPIGERNLKAHLVTAEVQAMDSEYQGALKEFSRVKLEPELGTQLQLLDDSASKLRLALSQSPQSTYLIPILRRTYLQRLQLTQKAMTLNFKKEIV
jgi:hypothetical protein